MKTVLAVIIAVLGAAVVVARPANSPATAPFSQTVEAVPRFQIVTAHIGVGEVGTQISVLLDTKTGCIWTAVLPKGGGITWVSRPLDQGVDESYDKKQMITCGEARVAAIESELPAAMQRPVEPPK